MVANTYRHKSMLINKRTTDIYFRNSNSGIRQGCMYMSHVIVPICLRPFILSRARWYWMLKTAVTQTVTTRTSSSMNRLKQNIVKCRRKTWELHTVYRCGCSYVCVFLNFWLILSGLQPYIHMRLPIRYYNKIVVLYVVCARQGKDRRNICKTRNDSTKRQTKTNAKGEPKVWALGRSCVRVHSSTTKHLPTYAVTNPVLLRSSHNEIRRSAGHVMAKARYSN